MCLEGCDRVCNPSKSMHGALHSNKQLEACDEEVSTSISLEMRCFGFTRCPGLAMVDVEGRTCAGSAEKHTHPVKVHSCVLKALFRGISEASSANQQSHLKKKYLLITSMLGISTVRNVMAMTGNSHRSDARQSCKAL